MKVLLAEDDFTMVSLLETLLGMEGFQTATVMDKPDSFLNVVRQEKPDIILLDVHLGHQDGIALMRSIRQTPDLEKTKVIMCSGISAEVECKAAGANDFLLKPFMPDDLIQKLRACLG
jgi:DNA-binding response OmpR family regulator